MSSVKPVRETMMSEPEKLDRVSIQRLASTLHWRSMINAMLMVADALMIVVAECFVLGLRRESLPAQALRFDTSVHVAFCLLVSAIVWVSCLRAVGIYHRHVMGDGYQVNLLIVEAGLLCWMALGALCFLLDMDLSLAGLNLTVAVGILLTMIARMAVRPMIAQQRRHGFFAYNTAVIGSPQGIMDTLHFLNQRQQLNYNPTAACPVRWNETIKRVESDLDGMTQLNNVTGGGLGFSLIEYDSAHLAQLLVKHNVQTVMVCDVFHRFSDQFNTFSVQMESMGLEVALITSAADAAGHETQIRSIQDATILTLRLPQYSMSTRIVKRTFDIVLSLLALITSALITVPVALAIKLTDGGPVFYTQQRIGLRGEPFRMIKFRSMVINADAMKAELAKQSGQEGRFIFKMKDDPRITPVGKFIRRFSIDELPQFLNVLKGDMSIVGPRPPLPEEYAQYNQVYATRMLVKPGITGPWQVSGRSDLSAAESERLDVSYVQNWSIVGDLVLMLRTVSAVLAHKGAY